MSRLLSQTFEEARRELPPKEQERCARLMSEAVRKHRSALRDKAAPKGKWARIAERFASEAPPHAGSGGGYAAVFPLLPRRVRFPA